MAAFCLVDVITTDESLCRTLPKTAAIFVVLLADVGAVVWLVAGRPWPSTSGTANLPCRGHHGPVPAAHPERDRPGRFAATDAADEEFLRRVRERAKEQRRRYREQRRRTTEEE